MFCFSFASSGFRTALCTSLFLAPGRLLSLNFGPQMCRITTFYLFFDNLSTAICTFVSPLREFRMIRKPWEGCFWPLSVSFGPQWKKVWFRGYFIESSHQFPRVKLQSSDVGCVDWPINACQPTLRATFLHIPSCWALSQNKSPLMPTCR